MKIIKNILRWISSIFTEEKEDDYRELYDRETNMED